MSSESMLRSMCSILLSCVLILGAVAGVGVLETQRLKEVNQQTREVLMTRDKQVRKLAGQLVSQAKLTESVQVLQERLQNQRQTIQFLARQVLACKTTKDLKELQKRIGGKGK